jgi:hypothetical protein
LRAKVQVTARVSAGTNPWDHHTDIIPGLMKCCPQVDQPTAGLIQDLKQRGLLDTTIVWWTGEFGRLPITRGAPAATTTATPSACCWPAAASAPATRIGRTGQKARIATLLPAGDGVLTAVQNGG